MKDVEAVCGGEGSSDRIKTRLGVIKGWGVCDWDVASGRTNVVYLVSAAEGCGWCISKRWAVWERDIRNTGISKV